MIKQSNRMSKSLLEKVFSVKDRGSNETLGRMEVDFLDVRRFSNWQKEVSRSARSIADCVPLTSRKYNEGASGIRYTIQFQVLERKRRKLRNNLPHLKFPLTPPSPQLSNLINFTKNSGSVYPIAHDDSWKKYLTFSTVISDAKVSK